MHGPLSAIFLVCFLFGSIFTLISLLTGAAHLALPGGHGLHVGNLHLGHLGHVAHAGHGAGAGQGHMAGGREGASPLNAGSLLAFLAWFGGVGYLLLNLSPLALLIVVVLAVLAGLIGASLIFFFLLKVLMPAQTVVDPEAYRLEGTAARVTARIPTGATGEIIYTKAGTRRSDAARSIDGEPIQRNEEVVILSYKRGIAYVQTMKRYLNSPAAEIAERLTALEDRTEQD
jgi:hypothetical protein